MSPEEFSISNTQIFFGWMALVREGDGFGGGGRCLNPTPGGEGRVGGLIRVQNKFVCLKSACNLRPH